MFTHPDKSAIACEHTRSRAFAQAGIFAVALFFLMFAVARADPGTATVNVVPLGGKHRGIVLKSQTVEATIGEDDGRMWADTSVWLRLQNPASKPITVTVALPGPQMVPAPLPGSLEVRVNKSPLTLVPASPAGGDQGLQATADIRVPARSGVDVRLSYRQDLPDEQGLVMFAYLLSGADQWAGTPDSLRVTVIVQPSVSPDAILDITPPPHRSQGQAFTWDWESEWAKSKPSAGLAFMTPTWFAAFEQARQAANLPDASALEHSALSEHYRRLASLPEPTFVTPALFRTRYYPAAVAELQTAIAASASVEEEVQARSQLAALYLQEAERAGSEGSRQYLQAAASEIELGMADPSPNSELVELARKVFGELERLAEVNGDAATAIGYRQRLDAAQTDSSAATNPDPSADRRLAQASLALDNKEFAAARDLLAAAYGPDIAVASGASPPVVDRTVITVTTTPTGRTIALRLGRDGAETNAAQLARAAAIALGSRSTSRAEAVADTVTITLVVPPGRALLDAQQSLASALPDAPELALLKAVLEDTRGFEETQTNLMKSTWRFTERADLSSAVRRWQGLAAQLDAAQTHAPAGAPATQAGEIGRIQRALWASDAAAWRSLTANSMVAYRYEESSRDVTREWQFQPGDTREMLIETSFWNLDTARWVVVALALIVGALAALLWRLG
jgi:hypothetical protein